MKIKLYQGSTLFDATKAMIKAIDNSQLSVMHTIIVPDRFSLQCERLILELFQQKALFNVRVVNLTRFSVELLGKLGVKLGQDDVLSSGETLLLTAKAIENVAKDFNLQEGETSSDENVEEEHLEDIELEARYVTQKIQELINSNYQVYYTKKQEFRPIKYKDIAILLRSTKTSAPIY